MVPEGASVWAWDFLNLALIGLSLQPKSTSASAGSTIAPLTNETSKWSVLTYAQRYADDEDESALYQGTLFVQLSRVLLDGCDLKLSVHVQDRFTGTTSKQTAFRSKTTSLGQQSETFNYEYLLKLTDLRQLEEKVLVGRPAQIQAHTGFICLEQPSCELTWLDVKVPSPLIREVRTTDGITDFDEMVKEITIRISSRQIAQKGRYCGPRACGGVSLNSGPKMIASQDMASTRYSEDLEYICQAGQNNGWPLHA